MFGIRQVIVGIEMPRTRPWSADNLSLPVQLALQNAIAIAGPSRLSVTLVAVLAGQTTGWFKSPHDAERLHLEERRDAEALLRHVAAGFNLTKVEVSVRQGSAWEELIRVAGNRPDSLVVCGTRDVQTLRRMLFGSTGLKLLRLTPGPVWIVKPRVDDNDSTDIVAATDLGPVGQDVLMTAVSFAKNLNARLHVVHCVEQSPETATSEDANRMTQQIEDAVRLQLAQTDQRTLPFGVRVYVKQQAPDEGILSVVSEAKADLVILGTSSKTGTSGLLPGSTVERLLPELSCSVLAIKPEGFRSALPADFWSVQRVS